LDSAANGSRMVRGAAIRFHAPPGRLCDVVDQRAAQNCAPPQQPRICLLGADNCAGARRPTLIPAGF
jgi:hypothetical protein